jgi:hypothetical protein
MTKDKVVSFGRAGLLECARVLASLFHGFVRIARLALAATRLRIKGVVAGVLRRKEANRIAAEDSRLYTVLTAETPKVMRGLIALRKHFVQNFTAFLQRALRLPGRMRRNPICEAANKIRR